LCRSLETAREWIRECKKYGDPNMVKVLLANKCDVKESRRGAYSQQEPPGLLSLAAFATHQVTLVLHT
jgi:hypothetical protein